MAFSIGEFYFFTFLHAQYLCDVTGGIFIKIYLAHFCTEKVYEKVRERHCNLIPPQILRATFYDSFLLTKSIKTAFPLHPWADHSCGCLSGYKVLHCSDRRHHFREPVSMNLLAIPF